MEKTVTLENQPFFTVLKKLSRDRKLANSYFHTLSEKDFSLACDQLGKVSENENTDPFSLKHNRVLVRFLRIVTFNYRSAFDQSIIELSEDQEAFRCILFASNKLSQLGAVQEKQDLSFDESLKNTIKENFICSTLLDKSIPALFSNKYFDFSSWKEKYKDYLLENKKSPLYSFLSLNPCDFYEDKQDFLDNNELNYAKILFDLVFEIKGH